jgi:hypothetical protein
MDMLSASSVHFLSSGLAGALVYSLTATICSAVYRRFRGNALPGRALNFCMGLLAFSLAFSLAFCAAWYVHTLLDSVVGWWTEPLAPHLTIIK